MEPITREEAKRRIAEIKEIGSTHFFDRTLSLNEFSNRLSNCGFTSAEITLIVMALRMIFVKFKKGE